MLKSFIFIDMYRYSIYNVHVYTGNLTACITHTCTFVVTWGNLDS